MIRTCGTASERLEDVDEPARAHQQRIAAGQQDVGDLRMVGDIAEAVTDVVHHLVVVVHEQPLPEAVAAVRPADLVAQEEHRIGVFVLDAACNGDTRLVAGVEPSPVDELLVARE